VLVAVCVFLSASFAFSGFPGDNPHLFSLSGDQYEWSFAGALSALKDGVEKDDGELTMNALNSLLVNDYEAKTEHKIKDLYNQFKETDTYSENIRLNWYHYDLRFIYLIFQYDELDRDAWLNYLLQVKTMSMTRNAKGIDNITFMILESARKIVPLDVFPAYIVGAIKDDSCDKQLFTILFDVYGDRITKEMLIAFAHKPKVMDMFREAIDKTAKDKCASSSEQLLKEHVDLRSIEKSVNFDQWPSNVMPENPGRRSPRVPLTEEQTYVREHGYSVDRFGFMQLLRDGCATGDEPMMQNALACLRDYTDRYTYEKIPEICEKFQKKRSLESIVSGELYVMMVSNMRHFDKLSASEIARCLHEAKSITLEKQDSVAKEEAFNILAAFNTQHNSFPCIMGAALKYPFSRYCLDASSHMGSIIFENDRDCITRDMLIGLCKTQGASSEYRNLIDSLAKEKFNSSFDELSKQEVDIEAVKKSLNLDQWPDSVLPKAAEAQETLGDK
jgi:hypothetical protein